MYKVIPETVGFHIAVVFPYSPEGAGARLFKGLFAVELKRKRKLVHLRGIGKVGIFKRYIIKRGFRNIKRVFRISALGNRKARFFAKCYGLGVYRRGNNTAALAVSINRIFVFQHISVIRAFRKE